jgi:hypothetical protein
MHGGHFNDEDDLLDGDQLENNDDEELSGGAASFEEKH